MGWAAASAALRCPDRVLVMDGAMGSHLRAPPSVLDGAPSSLTSLLSDGRDLAQCTEAQVVAAPARVIDLHRRFQDAGAVLHTTCTLNAQPTTLELLHGIGASAAALNTEAVAVSRGALRHDGEAALPLVLGSVGPTMANSSFPPGPGQADRSVRAIAFEELVSAYAVQVRALLEAGVDALLVETVVDAANCKAALCAIDTVARTLEPGGGRVPVLVSVTPGGEDTTLSQLPFARLAAALLPSWSVVDGTVVPHPPAYDLVALGVNCGSGAAPVVRSAEAMATALQSLLAACTEPYAAIAEYVPRRVCCYPNAGFPDADGRYAETPAAFAEAVAQSVAAGAHIVGGCCGTGPEHITAVCGAISGLPVPPALTPNTNDCAASVLCRHPPGLVLKVHVCAVSARLDNGSVSSLAASDPLDAQSSEVLMAVLRAAQDAAPTATALYLCVDNGNDSSVCASQRLVRALHSDRGLRALPLVLCVSPKGVHGSDVELAGAPPARAAHSVSCVSDIAALRERCGRLAVAVAMCVEDRLSVIES